MIEANGDRLLTTSLRPHLIFGPRDNHLLPSLVEKAKTGRVPQVGDGTNKVDLTYVEDAARAHLLAADALAPGSPVAGGIYFISQDSCGRGSRSCCGNSTCRRSASAFRVEETGERGTGIGDRG